MFLCDPDLTEVSCWSQLSDRSETDSLNLSEGPAETIISEADKTD